MSATVTERHRELAQNAARPCSCDEAYAGRNLTDPTCIYCDIGDDIAQAIADAEERGREAGIREAAALFQKSGSLSQSLDANIAARILALLPEVKP